MRLWIFLGAESIFNLGLSVFFLLYNLHLLDLGFDERFVGMISALLTAGSICGTLPAGWFASRFGVGAALRVTFAAGAGVCAIQAWATRSTVLLALSFAGGLAAAFRAVSIAPAVAQLSNEKNRPRAFSLVFSLGIGMGVLGGLIGGRLPEWIGGARAKQLALLAGCGFSALALIPTLWLKFPPGAVSERKRVAYPRSRFVIRYLTAAAAWNLFVGAFPPFFNTYFARRFGSRIADIGLIFSASQLAQVGAMLAAPLLFRRTGLAPGIVASQMAAAVLLALLAPSWPLASAGIIYACYMAFQWMSEPGWHTLLMNGVKNEEQSGASSLNFLVIFSAQAVASLLFGQAAARGGYPAALLGAAAAGFAAAFVFQQLFTTSQTSSR